MLAALDFPASGFERMALLKNAENAQKIPFIWGELSDDQKLAYVLGMYRGYYQGKREQAQAAIDNFAASIIGFKP